MTKRVSVVMTPLLALVLALALPAAAPLQAQEDRGAVIAEGFNAPQGVLVGEDGVIWVTDSGVGGETEFDTVTPQGDEVVGLLGDTAVVARIDAGGDKTVVANMPSILAGDEAIGGARLTLLDGELYVTNGGWVSDGSEDAEAFEKTAAVLKVNDDGSTEEVAQLWPLEKEENPDGTIIESHPYGIIAGPDGMLWVADAGGNTLQRIDPATGDNEVVTVFDPIPGVFPSPTRGGEMLADPVPTGLDWTDDGNLLVSFLSGAPFVPGSAKVVEVTPDGDVSDYATELTMLTDLTRGPDGEFYGVQFAVFTDQGPTPNSGAIVRIAEGEGSTPVLEGLAFPTSIDFNEDGDAYITVNGGGPPGAGALVMYEGIAAGEMASEAEEQEAAGDEAPEATATPEPEEEMADEEASEATATPEPEEEMADEEASEATATPELEEEMADEEAPEPTATPEPEEEMAEEEASEATATPEPEEEMAEEEASEATATPEPEEEMADEEAPEPTATPEAEEEMEVEVMDVVDTAAANDDFSTLVAAIQAAGLVDALKGEGPFTIFAPTNAAFEALPEGTFDSLLDDPGGELTEILLAHVIQGEAMAADISDGLEIDTLQGSALTFSVDGETVMVNDATIIATDIAASNGVIHAIDSVLMLPAEEDAADEETAEDAVAAAGETPSVTVSDQESGGMQVTVDTVVAAEPGWIVIHADDDGAPGPVLGQTGVAPGANENIVVMLDESISGETPLHAMLHVDAGEQGAYEFPGADGPVTVDGSVVNVPFTATAPAAEDEAADEDMAEEDAADEDAADEDVADEDMADEEMMDEEMEDEDLEAPETMPDTGSEPTTLPVLLVVMGALAVLAGGAAVRRRLA